MTGGVGGGVGGENAPANAGAGGAAGRAAGGRNEGVLEVGARMGGRGLRPAVSPRSCGVQGGKRKREPTFFGARPHRLPGQSHAPPAAPRPTPRLPKSPHMTGGPADRLDVRRGGRRGATGRGIARGIGGAHAARGAPAPPAAHAGAARLLWPSLRRRDGWSGLPERPPWRPTDPPPPPRPGPDAPVLPDVSWPGEREQGGKIMGAAGVRGARRPRMRACGPHAFFPRDAFFPCAPRSAAAHAVPTPPIFQAASPLWPPRPPPPPTASSCCRGRPAAARRP